MLAETGPRNADGIAAIRIALVPAYRCIQQVSCHHLGNDLGEYSVMRSVIRLDRKTVSN